MVVRRERGAPRGGRGRARRGTGAGGDPARRAPARRAPAPERLRAPCVPPAGASPRRRGGRVRSAGRAPGARRGASGRRGDRPHGHGPLPVAAGERGGRADRRIRGADLADRLIARGGRAALRPAAVARAPPPVPAAASADPDERQEQEGEPEQLRRDEQAEQHEHRGHPHPQERVPPPRPLRGAQPPITSIENVTPSASRASTNAAASNAVSGGWTPGSTRPSAIHRTATAIGIAVPNAPAESPSGEGSNRARARTVAGLPSRVPATRTSRYSTSFGCASELGSRSRRAVRTSRGTASPLGVSTGSRPASPSDTRKAKPSWVALGSASRHRTSRTPGIVWGRVAGSECSVYIADCTPTGSGKSHSITPEPAGTSPSSPSSKTMAGRVNSSSTVSAEYGTANDPLSPAGAGGGGPPPGGGRGTTPASRNRPSSSSCRRVVWNRPPRSA